MQETIRKHAELIKTAVEKNKRPSIKIPKRSLTNVVYDKFFKLGKAVVTRTLTYNTIKTFAQTLRVLALMQETLDSDDELTKRELYYVSKGWDDARFLAQPESDMILDDIEALLSTYRESLGVTPEEKGGEVAGRLIVLDKDRKGADVEIDCTKFASGAYSIPSSVEHLKFQTKAKFVLAIETAGMFQRLNNHAFWDSTDCILISMGGVPTRACRRFIRKLSDDHKLPVYGFTDGDPFAYGNIYRTLKVGSGNSAHINEYFRVPSAQFLGVTPYDIEKYDLPTHPLKDTDVKRLNDLLKNDPFFKQHKIWQKAVEKMLKSGQRVEQQAFAKHGLNYVINTYLPEKIAKNDFLP